VTQCLVELGFLYDSSRMGDDFNPYYLRKDDRWSADEPYTFGPLTDLVELPVTWGLDDFPPFETLMGINPGQSAPSAVEEIWYGDFEFALKNCPGGIYTLTMHPEFIGRGHRILMLERLIQRFKGHSGVRFSTLRDYAAASFAEDVEERAPNSWLGEFSFCDREIKLGQVSAIQMTNEIGRAQLDGVGDLQHGQGAPRSLLPGIAIPLNRCRRGARGRRSLPAFEGLA
jgi:hypothetical protein